MPETEVPSDEPSLQKGDQLQLTEMSVIKNEASVSGDKDENCPAGDK